MRSMEMSAKTVEAAVQAACEALGVDRDDINVSYEVLEFPTRKLFKTIPAKVLVKVEEPEAEKPAEVSTKPAEVVEISDETAPEIQKEVVEDMVEEAELAPVPGEEVEVPLDIDADPRLQAAVDYLTPIFNLMGVENFTFTAVKKGAATVLKVSGEHMGALIGRRGETMESLSYLASLVVNRMEGPYVKLGLDVGGYRNKREDDLSALARRIADRVIRTGCYYEMEPMNPYERHIIHTAIAEIDGVRSESKGDGPARHVVLYSTDPDACNLPDRDNARNQRGGRRDGGRGPRLRRHTVKHSRVLHMGYTEVKVSCKLLPAGIIVGMNHLRIRCIGDRIARLNRSGSINHILVKNRMIHESAELFKNIALISGADVRAKIRLDSETRKIRLCFDRRLLRVIELPCIAFHSAAIFFRKLSCIGGCDFFIGKQGLTQLLRQILIRRKCILRHADKHLRIRIGNSEVPRFSMIELVLRDMEQHRFWMLF